MAAAIRRSFVERNPSPGSPDLQFHAFHRRCSGFGVKLCGAAAAVHKCNRKLDGIYICFMLYTMHILYTRRVQFECARVRVGNPGAPAGLGNVARACVVFHLYLCGCVCVNLYLTLSLSLYCKASACVMCACKHGAFDAHDARRIAHA